MRGRVSLMAYGKSKGLSKGAKIGIGAGIAVVVIGIIIAAVMVVRSGIFDTSMKLRLVEGTVNIEDTKGNITPAGTNKQFESGDIISTSYDGYASVTLDGTKNVSIDGYTRAEFYKKGKTIGVKLIKGGLFFEVSQHLNDDELFQLQSNNVTITLTKGSSGYFEYDESGLQTLYVTNGVVRVDAYNARTGQRKSAEVRGGQKASLYLYDKATGSSDSIKLLTSDIRPQDLPDFPLKVMSRNSQLLKTVCSYTGWDESEVQYYINKLPGMGTT
jgi:hypothetical protein